MSLSLMLASLASIAATLFFFLKLSSDLAGWLIDDIFLLKTSTDFLSLLGNEVGSYVISSNSSGKSSVYRSFPLN